MSDFHIRPAQLTDLPQIQAIFAHYIENTTTSLYCNPIPPSILESKYQATLNQGLPYLVAVAATPQTQPRFTATSGLDTDTSTNYTSTSTTTILGYTSASAFRAPKLGFSPTVELSIFIHQSHWNHGIGGALMTALLDILRDTSTRHRASEPGYDNEPHDFHIRNVLAVMVHDVHGPAAGDGHRLIEWYRRFGFQCVGRLSDAGFKFGRWLDVVYLQLNLGDGLPGTVDGEAAE